MDGRPATTYRMSRAFVLRAMGMIIVGVGVVWLLVGVVALVGVDLPTWALVVPLVLTVLVLAAAVARLVWRPRLLELSDEGYRVRIAAAGPAGEGASVRAASWREVESVETRDVGGQSVVVLALAGGRRTVVLCRLLGDRAVEAQREMHERLNAAHGYRRLDRP